MTFKNIVLSTPVQIALILAMAAIIVAAFVTHQTTALGSLLSVLASAMGAFLYRSGWLHGGDTAPLDAPDASSVSPNTSNDKH